MKHTTNAFIYLSGISVTDYPTSTLGTLDFKYQINNIN